MQRRVEHILQNTLVALDVLGLNLSGLSVLYLINERVLANDSYYYYDFFILFNLSWLYITWLMNLYNEQYGQPLKILISNVVVVYLIWVSVILLYFFFTGKVPESRIFLMAVFSIAFSSIILNRFIYVIIRYFFKINKILNNRVIILGYNDTAKQVAHFLQSNSLNTELVGFAENYKNINELSNYPIVSQIGNTIETSKRLRVNEILSTITPKQNREVLHLMEKAEKECIHFHFVPDFYYLFRKQTFIEYYDGLPILSIRKEPLEDVGNRIRKRILDIMISSFVLLFVMSWMIPLLGLFIFLESPGPIFFSQKRTGKNNKVFHCLKFRSMHINVFSDLKQATKNDSRITKVGKFLRQSSLDEFPQFINVFLGHMSLVGPRPHMTKHTEDYSKIVSSYMVRQFLKPGITGWAQVNGYRGEIKDQESITKRVEHDLWYLENWSIWLDLKIIFLTACNIFKGEKNAY